MQCWKTFLVLAVTVCWSLAATHCKLEVVSSLPFLACSDEAPADHHDDGCKEDGCSVVETGLYKAGNSRVTLPMPHLFTVAFVLLGVESRPNESDFLFAAPEFPPPEMAVTWQFSRRTASSPRAPSIVS